MEKRQFEIGKNYTGCGMYGEATVKVVKRTPKMIVIEHHNQTQIVKILDTHQEMESISFKAWLFTA